MKHKQLTEKDLQSMSNEEILAVTSQSLERATKLCALMAQALLHYGQHEESCTDEEICSCGLTPAQNAAVDFLQKVVMMTGTDNETLN